MEKGLAVAAETAEGFKRKVLSTKPDRLFCLIQARINQTPRTKGYETIVHGVVAAAEERPLILEVLCPELVRSNDPMLVAIFVELWPCLWNYDVDFLKELIDAVRLSTNKDIQALLATIFSLYKNENWSERDLVIARFLKTQYD